MNTIPANCRMHIAHDVVTIRPICTTDTGMEANFVRALSPATAHYRFLGGKNELLPQELRKLCTMDGTSSMAFVATIRSNGIETEIGVSRYSPGSNADTREIAVTVADSWQHTGLGMMLVQKLIQAARDHGVRHLYSIDFADNTAMQALARDLGMTTHQDPDDRQQVIYSLAL